MHCQYTSEYVQRALAVVALLFTTFTSAAADYRLDDRTEIAPLEMFQECDVCPEMIAMPLGRFQMGAPRDEARLSMVYADGRIQYVGQDHPSFRWEERPIHEVQIDLPFAIGRTEITYAQWDACLADGGCNGYRPEDRAILPLPRMSDKKWVDLGPDHPVWRVSYLDALSYIAWLNKRVSAEVYRLPTEAEWEYAARAGTTTPYPFGERLFPHQANYAETKHMQELAGIDEPENINRRGAPVSVYDLDAANAWDLRHTAGNVDELTQSCWTETYAGWLTSSEWLKKSSAQSCRRASRGGGFGLAMQYARSASRGNPSETSRSQLIGFRVARDLK